MEKAVESEVNDSNTDNIQCSQSRDSVSVTNIVNETVQIAESIIGVKNHQSFSEIVSEDILKDAKMYSDSMPSSGPNSERTNCLNPSRSKESKATFTSVSPEDYPLAEDSTKIKTIDSKLEPNLLNSKSGVVSLENKNESSQLESSFQESKPGSIPLNFEGNQNGSKCESIRNEINYDQAIPDSKSKPTSSESRIESASKDCPFESKSETDAQKSMSRSTANFEREPIPAPLESLTKLTQSEPRSDVSIEPNLDSTSIHSSFSKLEIDPQDSASNVNIPKSSTIIDKSQPELIASSDHADPNTPGKYPKTQLIESETNTEATEYQIIAKPNGFDIPPTTFTSEEDTSIKRSTSAKQDQRGVHDCKVANASPRTPRSKSDTKVPVGIISPKERKTSQPISEIVVPPRYANFLQTTSHKSLVRSATMEEVVNKLSSGAYLWKIRGTSKHFNRHYKVDIDSMSLVAESKKWWSPGSLASVPLVEVEEVRLGWKTDTFNKVSDHLEKLKEKGTSAPVEPNFDETNCFSLIHGTGGREVLDLVANSQEERDLWVTGLKHLIESVQSLHQERQYDVWLRKKFEAADEDRNGSLTLDEVCKLVASLNLKMNRSHARMLFNEANKNKRKRGSEQALDAQEFVFFYHSLQKMPEVEALYKKYANKETKVMCTEDLLNFLRQEQGMSSMQENEATQFIHDFELSSLKNDGFLSFDGFYHLLLSDVFNVYNGEHQKTIHQDMREPISHYFISSSHNTYLTGHQLAGESSVEGYISALKKGCRVVELDVWDGDDGEPIIYHGHTLTTKITLADVLRDAIKIYAFTASPYPVILSIENHLSLEQQVIMVRLLKEILGDMLHSDPVPQDIKILPSPEDLKHKILVKAKKPKGIEVEDDDEDDDQDNIDYIDSDDTGLQTKKAKHHKPLAPELAQVVNVCEGKKFVSLGCSFETDKCVHFPSLRENKAKSLLESSPAEFIKFTSRQISKIYPHGTRTDSSNLKPYPFWSIGAQVVTLNMQTEDKATFYNEALFRSNGNCGYVLKPDILLEPILYDPANPPSELARVLRVKIISGQHLPPSEKKNDIVDPYIQLKVRGHPMDKQKQKTKTIRNNGFNPVWNETLEVRIKVPPVSLVYFTVRDESSLAKDPVLARACIPFASITTGYRHVHFTDITGKILSPAALFIHVSLGEN